MKWKAIKYSPKRGEKRVRKVFAWKKTLVGDYIVWLETYQVYEEFFIPVSGTDGWWSETKREPLFFTIA